MVSENESRKPALRSGVVTSIQGQKKDADRVSIFIDGEFAFGLSGGVAVQEGLVNGRMLSVEEQERILALEDGARARATALAYVAERARTEHEVRRKLARSGFSAEVSETAIQRLVSLGYLNDRDYADRYALVRLQRRYGPRRVIQELIRRGIDPALAEEAVRHGGEKNDVDQQAYDAARRRADRLQSEPDIRRRRKKLYDFLVRRGYDAQIARETVQAVEESEWR